MPYTNIVFIKLFLDLFDEDERFLYELTERQQLLYIKLLYLAGRTRNHIPQTANFIIDKVKYSGNSDDLSQDIAKISQIFPKFKSKNGFYFFKKFAELHNRTTDGKVGSSKGTPKELQRVIPKEKEKEKEKKKEKEKPEWLLKEPDPKDMEKVSQLIKRTLNKK